MNKTTRNSNSNSVTEAIMTISPQMFKQGMENGVYDLVIDVRSYDEWNDGRIATAVHVPLESLANINQILLGGWSGVDSSLFSCDDHCATIVVYCRNGARADVAIQTLSEDLGYTGTLYKGQGIIQWIEAGYDLVDDSSSPPPPSDLPPLNPPPLCTTANICAEETPLAPSNDTWDPIFYSDGVIFLFLLGIVFAIMILMIRLWQIQKKRNADNGNGNSNSNSNGNGNGWRRSSTGGYSVRTQTAGRNIRLSLEDRIELYNTMFDSNGNQLTLESKHFVTKTTKTTNNDNNNNNNNNNNSGREEKEEEERNHTKSFVDIELGDDVGDDDSSISLSIELDRNELNVDCINQNSTTRLRLDPKKEKNSIINHGSSCIICFEEFVNGDVIVWSNDASCHHIYHKDCMVHYLATTNTTRKGTTSLLTDDRTNNCNPCPTCRRPNYCVVSREDLAQLKAMIQPQTTTTTANESSNNNNDDNEETVDEAATSTANLTVTMAL